jgi:hypothetical protein
MNTHDPRPNLSAFLLAIGRLDADEATALKIARLFGVDIEAPAQAAPPLEPRPPGIARNVEIAVNREGPASTTAATPTGAIEPTGTLPPAADEEQPLVAVRKAGPSLRPVETGRALPPSPRWSGQELSFQPLIRPIANRAIVSSALAHRSAGGAIDVDRLVELCARRQVITDVPRLPRWSIAGRTLVLIDRGAGMGPFARDGGDLAESIAAIASRDRTEVRRFWRTPRLVGNAPTAAKAINPPPPRGTAVVALTDLGIAPDAPEGLIGDWLAFAAAIAKAGCTLVVFVPYPASRWPAALAEKLSIVTWDRGTSLASVIAAVHRRPSADLRGGRT